MGNTASHHGERSALFECVVYRQVGGKRISGRGSIMSKVWSEV